MDTPELTPDELRLAVIAADPLARAGLVSLLEDEPGIAVDAGFDLSADPEGLNGISPEVLLIDLGWEVEAEMELLGGWLELELPLVVLVASDRDPAPLWGLGVTGILRRSSSREQLATALRTAASGLRVHDPTFMTRRAAVPSEPVPSESLTAREMEVLQLLAEGSSNRAIAEALSISEHTVKFHVTAILAKLDAESRTEAAMIAARAGLILL